MIKTLLILGLGIGIGSLFVFQVYKDKYWYPVEKSDETFLQSLNTENVSLSSYEKSIEDSVLTDLGEKSRYCWDTIKLVNGETLTGSFATNFGDGDYFLRKEDSLFIPKKSILYFK